MPNDESRIAEPDATARVRSRQPDDVYAQVGQRLRTLRTQAGLTQAAVAAIINVSSQQYQKYEDAQSKCSLTYLMILADHYGVPIASLLPGGGTGGEAPRADLPTEADLLARLVTGFVGLGDLSQKLRLVQLVESIVDAERKRG